MPEYPPGRPLTKRQSAILDLVGRGLSNKVIGFELGISEQVVKEHVSALLRRLDARNRGALGAAALARGVIGSFQVNPAWLRYLFREAPVPIAVVVGPQHRHVAFNRSYEVVAGARRLLGMRYVDAFPERVSMQGFLNRAYRTGERISARAVLQPARDDKGAVAGVIIFDDRSLPS
jgi:DNA-binding CsgD family transcriptional regulator